MNILPKPEVNREQCIDGLCTFEGQVCNKVYSDEKNGNVCIAYEKPSRWIRGCRLSSIVRLTEKQKKKINPLKASRRKNRR